MPEMIEQSELVTFICPNCGYTEKGKRGESMTCPKCIPDFSGWIGSLQEATDEKAE